MREPGNCVYTSSHCFLTTMLAGPWSVLKHLGNSTASGPSVSCRATGGSNGTRRTKTDLSRSDGLKQLQLARSVHELWTMQDSQELS